MIKLVEPLPSVIDEGRNNGTTTLLTVAYAISKGSVFTEIKYHSYLKDIKVVALEYMTKINVNEFVKKGILTKVYNRKGEYIICDNNFEIIEVILGGSEYFHVPKEELKYAKLS